MSQVTPSATELRSHSDERYKGYGAPDEPPYDADDVPDVLIALDGRQSVSTRRNSKRWRTEKHPQEWLEIC